MATQERLRVPDWPEAILDDPVQHYFVETGWLLNWVHATYHWSSSAERLVGLAKALRRANSLAPGDWTDIPEDCAAARLTKLTEMVQAAIVLHRGRRAREAKGPAELVERIG